MKTYLLKSAPAVEPKAAPKTARPRLPNLPDPPDEAVRDLLRACHQVVPLRHNLRSAGTTAWTPIPEAAPHISRTSTAVSWA